MADGLSRRPDACVAGAGDAGATWKLGVRTEFWCSDESRVRARQWQEEREQEMAFFFF